MDQDYTRHLIKNSISGDMASFKKLVETHQSYIYAVAFRLLCNSYEAEDITQETFLRVWKNLKHFKLEMRFTTWLYKISVNLCYDKIKSREHRKSCIQDSVSKFINLASTDDLETDLINREMVVVIRYLTGQLTPKQNIVFTLSELEGLSVEEIAGITGLSPAKIKSNLYCARQNIKNKLNIMEVKYETGR